MISTEDAMGQLPGSYNIFIEKTEWKWKRGR